MIEMEEERLRMREHVMNEVWARSPSHSASSMLPCDVTASVPFPGGHQQRQTRLFRGVPGRYSEKGILGARQLGGDVTPERWSRWGKTEFFFVGIGRHICCVSLDVGAEYSLYRRGDERVRGAPHSAGAGPEHEVCRPPETERRSGATTGRAQRPEGWATTGKQRWLGAKFSEKDNIMYDETLLIVGTL